MVDVDKKTTVWSIMIKKIDLLRGVWFGVVTNSIQNLRIWSRIEVGLVVHEVILTIGNSHVDPEQDNRPQLALDDVLVSLISFLDAATLII